MHKMALGLDKNGLVEDSELVWAEFWNLRYVLQNDLSHPDHFVEGILDKRHHTGVLRHGGSRVASIEVERPLVDDLLAQGDLTEAVVQHLSLLKEHVVLLLFNHLVYLST